jgi:hypothetical protein
MALKLTALLFNVIVQIGSWEIVTSQPQPDQREIDRWVQVLNRAERTVDDQLGLPLPASVLRVWVAPSSGDFSAWTGCTIWQGAAVMNGELITQPQHVLEHRGVLEEVITHEFVHLVLQPYDIPLWVNEGLAVLYSGQVSGLGHAENLPEAVEEIEMLLKSSDTLELRRGYLAAAAQTSKIISEVGRDSLIHLVIQEAL